MKEPSAYNPRYIGAERDAPPRPCAWPECDKAARYRAPKTRDNLRDYVMFCLDHVRAYNAQWNFFQGMSSAEIDEFRVADVTGHRPTWRLGLRHAPLHVRLRAADIFGFLGHTARPMTPEEAEANREERRALEVLSLEEPLTMDVLKARFKLLVKRHHPDANAGDRRTEDRLRAIIQSYRLLLRRWRR